MGTRRIYQGANFGASSLGRSERLISAGIVASATVTAGSQTLTNVVIAAGTAAIGQTITGAGIPDATTITGFGPASLIISANATATANGVAVQSTSRTGLVGEYLFGRDVATSKFNLCGGQPLTFTGVPAFGARYATMDAARWADTGLYDSQELTLLAVCSIPSGNSAFLVTDFNGSNIAGTIDLDVTAGNFRGLVPATDNTSASATTFAPRAPLTDYTVKAMRTTGSANFTVKIDEYRAGARVGGSSLTTTKTRKLNTTETLAIGSKRGAVDSGNGIANFAGVAVWSRALSDTELLAEAAAITAKMAAWPQQQIAV